MKITSELVAQAKLRLGDRAAHIIAKDLNIEDWDDKNLVGKTIFKSENTASMHWYPKACSFHCFSTNKNYDIIQHYISFYHLSFVDAAKKLLIEVGDYDSSSDESKDELNSLFTCKERDKFFEEYKFPKDEPANDRAIVNAYMARRGISEETLDYCNVKQDANGNTAFQFIDEAGRHVMTKYRVSKPKSNGGLKWWFQKDADTCPILYGVDKIDISKPLVIVEGLVDRISLVEAGVFNTVSINGGAADDKWIDFNWDIIEKVPEIILFADDDEPGKKMMKETAARIGESRCRIVKPPKDVKEKIKAFFATFKLDIDKVDANNVLVICGKDTLRQLVEQAEMIPNKSLKYLMSVEETDIKDIEKMSTGYKNLDNILYGSLMGCFTILSGPSGAGKSTIANQLCVLSPLEQGYKTFIYSGELSEGQLKNWIVKPLAGVDHIIRWKNPNTPAGYTPTREASKTISQFYMKDVILQSDEDALSASNDEILKQMEDAFRRYGCKVFLIDNLMTVGFNDDGDDIWKSQKEFIKRLLRFTNKYSVNVTLVAHPKKPSKGEEPGVYSIHGASELVNLCHRLLWVDLLKNDSEKYNSEIRVIKDRPTGRSGKSCKLYYDNRTMRLYSDVAEQYHQYAWARKSNIKYSEEIEKKLAVNFVDETDEVLGENPS